jgi:hypothetical protein
MSTTSGSLLRSTGVRPVTFAALTAAATAYTSAILADYTRGLEAIESLCENA